MTFRKFILSQVLIWGSFCQVMGTYSVSSPDGALTLSLEIPSDTQGSHSSLRYAVHYRNQTVLQESRMGIELKGGQFLGRNSRLLGIESGINRQDFIQAVGKRRHVTALASESIFHFEERDSQFSWSLIIRAFDDGVAWRYHFHGSPMDSGISIVEEMTEFALPAESEVYALPLNGFTTSYEKLYRKLPGSEIPSDWLSALPMLFKSSSGLWAAITEADIEEYAGTYLQAYVPGRLTSRLSPLPDSSGLAVRHGLPHKSPWRILLTAQSAGDLLESDLVIVLTQPSRIADTSWIKTGKTTFPWWNGFHERGVDFVPGLNTETAKYYIDFCSEMGIPYHSLDGLGDKAWYDGPIVPYEGADPTTPIPGLDLNEVLTYAASKNVRIRLWMNWEAARDHMDRAFPLYRQWGIEGVMLDFMDRDDQEMNRFVHRAVKLAADNHLTVTLHGCPKPSGLERTYPNLLSHEAVMNLEYDKWEPGGIPPEHEVTVPYTRMLAGPLDFHQGSFRTVSLKEFQPRNEAPLVIGTPSRTLASYVVYQNHLSMVADSPSAYRNLDPGLIRALSQIPTNWDDTKFVDGDVGEFVVVARRQGNDWYIGAMNDETPRNIRIKLAFLSKKDYTIKQFNDRPELPPFFEFSESLVADTDSLDISLAAHGGAYIRLTPSED